MPPESLFPITLRLGTRTFLERDQEEFAAATGDVNPMHMDKVAARRTQAGAPVVHGMNMLLWMLERVAAHPFDLSAVASVKAHFTRLVLIGDQVETVLTQRDAGSCRLDLLCDGEPSVRALIKFGPASHAEPVRVEANAWAMPLQPLDPSWSEVAGSEGHLQFAHGSAQLRALFPALTGAWGAGTVAALACTSSLVGMVVPGLRSIYGNLTFRLDPRANWGEALAFRVTGADENFHLIQQEFSGGGIAGTLECFQRQGPTAQPTMESVAKHVEPSAFSGHTAFIVGGSRGLGELTAKIIAAGGGNVIVTYAVGRTEAEAVCAEIVKWGGRCRVARYNALENAPLAELPEVPTHYYYFATPAIFARKSRAFVQEAFDAFNAFYIAGFDRLVRAGRSLRPAGIRVFYPSSVAVEGHPPGLAAYAMSKAAGEVLCADMNANLENVQVVVARLPRLPTDQTAALQQVETGDPLSVMLPLVHRMHGTAP